MTKYILELYWNYIELLELYRKLPTVYIEVYDEEWEIEHFQVIRVLYTGKIDKR